MNLLVRIVLIAVGSAALQSYFPWWTAVCVALVVEAVLGKGGATKFFSGFYGVAIPWIVLALYIDMNNNSILSERILEMFKLPPYGFVMVIVTGLVGGMMGGLGSLVGGWIKQAWTNE